MSRSLLPRGVLPRFRQMLAAAPVVVLEGPRASGKTALGEMLESAGLLATRVDLGDPTLKAAAAASPASFIDNLRVPAFIDEAQLVPELPLAIKRRVDREGRAGMFVLTGSSRLGRAQLGGSDPLAGRSLRQRLWPMTQGELAGNPVNLVPTLFDRKPLPAAPPGARIGKADLIARIRRGGLPGMAGVTGSVEPLLRGQLMQEYVEGVLFHEIGRRHDRAEMLRMFRYLAASTARIANLSAIGNDLKASRITVVERLASLDASFLLHQLAGHRSSEHRTLTAHPKIHAVDCGLAAWAARLDDDAPPAVFGALLETFVVGELAAQASWAYPGETLRHWRDTARKLEVDAMILHPDGSAIAVEVKAGEDVRPDDLKGLRTCLAATEAKRGVVFYSGAMVLQFEENIWAVPVTSLWTGLMEEPRRSTKRRGVAARL
ncbi:MAG: ATP-binding protein [Burkholderiales bacterium]|nr:ATP-binding protein [Burkholderiales bacterium]